jgi:hypothetical protein
LILLKIIDMKKVQSLKSSDHAVAVVMAIANYGEEYLSLSISFLSNLIQKRPGSVIHHIDGLCGRIEMGGVLRHLTGHPLTIFPGTSHFPLHIQQMKMIFNNQEA